MSITLSNYTTIKNQIDIQNMPLKREIDTAEMTAEEAKITENYDNSASDISGSSDNETTEETNNTFDPHPLDYIKKEFLLDFGSNLFRNQNPFKADSYPKSPFLLPTQLYKNFLANLEKRRRNVADCYSLYQRNLLFSNGLGFEPTDDDGQGERSTDSPDEVIKVV